MKVSETIELVFEQAKYLTHTHNKGEDEEMH